MARTTKAQREAETKLRAAFDAGCDHFTAKPDAWMTDVHRHASAIYPDDKELALEFALGYATTRRCRDEYRREKRDGST